MTSRYKRQVWWEKKRLQWREFFQAFWIKSRIRFILLVMTYRASPLDFRLFWLARFGHLGAYDRLLERYQTPLQQLAFLLLGEKNLAERAFFAMAKRFFDEMPQRAIDRPVRILLFRAMVHECLGNPTLVEGKVELLLKKSISEDVRFIDQLSQDERLVVILFDLCGLRDFEVAKVLDVTRGTVRSRLHAGRFRLKSASTPMAMAESA